VGSCWRVRGGARRVATGTRTGRSGSPWAVRAGGWHAAGVVRVRIVRAGALAVAGALLAGACTPADVTVPPTPGPGSPQATAAPSAGPEADRPPAVAPVRVGTGPEAESRLLAHVLAELVRAADVPAVVVELADRVDARRALELGDVDVLPGYTGEAWLEVLGRADPPSDQRPSFARVREFDEDAGLLWQRPVFASVRGPEEPPADATFAFVVQGPPGVHADLRTVSQLAARLAQLPDAALCVDPEFAARRDGLRAVLDAYSVSRDALEVVPATPDLAVVGVAQGQCVAGLTTATDGRAWASGQYPLVDDLGVFPAFVVAPLVRDDVRERSPGLLAAIAPFGNGLTTATLGRWNGRVASGEPVEVVALDAVRVLLRRAGRL
jgi:osmoprotectant transport system substrate-binding protein